MQDFQNNALRDRLIGELIGLARATEGNEHLITPSTNRTTEEVLCAVGTDAQTHRLQQLLEQVDGEKRKMVPMCYQCAASCGRTNGYDMAALAEAAAEIRQLKLQILKTICALAAAPGQKDYSFFYLALYAIGREDWSEADLVAILQKAEKMLMC